jgi:hypothetical protein
MPSFFFVILAEILKLIAMKKFILVAGISFLAIHSFAFTSWQPFGPEGINALKMRFLYTEDLITRPVILIDTGFYLEVDSQWEFYSFHTPDIEYVDDQHVFVVNSAGSYSDGLYRLDIQTHESEVVHYCLNPAFIRKIGNTYYLGYEGGLQKSSDGLTWTAVEYFDAKNCTFISTSYYPPLIFEEKILIGTDETIDNTYISDNGGSEWYQIYGDLRIVAATYSASASCFYANTAPDSQLNGFFQSNSSSWDNIFFSENLNTVGRDNTGDVFLGWISETGEQKGVAKYNNPGLTFYNELLPDFHINNLSSTPDLVCGAIIYCCTPSGVYRGDIETGITAIESADKSYSLSNPMIDNVLHIVNNSDKYINFIEIYTLSGRLVQKAAYHTNANIIDISLPLLTQGTYICNISTENGNQIRKFVKL